MSKKVKKTKEEIVPVEETKQEEKKFQWEDLNLMKNNTAETIAIQCGTVVAMRNQLLPIIQDDSELLSQVKGVVDTFTELSIRTREIMDTHLEIEEVVNEDGSKSYIEKNYIMDFDENNEPIKVYKSGYVSDDTSDALTFRNKLGGYMSILESSNNVSTNGILEILTSLKNKAPDVITQEHIDMLTKISEEARRDTSDSILKIHRESMEAENKEEDASGSESK